VRNVVFDLALYRESKQAAAWNATGLPRMSKDDAKLQALCFHLLQKHPVSNC
jgi:hypothetical protein